MRGIVQIGLDKLFEHVSVFEINVKRVPFYSSKKNWTRPIRKIERDKNGLLL